KAAASLHLGQGQGRRLQGGQGGYPGHSQQWTWTGPAALPPYPPHSAPPWRAAAGVAGGAGVVGMRLQAAGRPPQPTIWQLSPQPLPKGGLAGAAMPPLHHHPRPPAVSPGSPPAPTQPRAMVARTHPTGLAHSQLPPQPAPPGPQAMERPGDQQLPPSFYQPKEQEQQQQELAEAHQQGVVMPRDETGNWRVAVAASSCAG
ncbi:hypothetical protein V8C86DRAFT_2583111, partial [Haematococcus lacustris]